MCILASLFSYEIMLLDESNKDMVLVYAGDNQGTFYRLTAKQALPYLRVKLAGNSYQKPNKIAVIHFNGLHLSPSAHFRSYFGNTALFDYPYWLLLWVQNNIDV